MALKNEYFTVAQAAKSIGATRQTIYRWIKEGRFPVEKIGKEKLIKKSIFKKFENYRVQSIMVGLMVSELIETIREQYNLTEEDLVLPTQGDQKNPFRFSITWKDGREDIVNIKLGLGKFTKLTDSGAVVKYDIDISKKPK